MYHEVLVKVNYLILFFGNINIIKNPLGVKKIINTIS